MNINDVDKVDEVEDGDLLKAIFEKQELLYAKYQGIEVLSGLRVCNDFPVNLHDPKGQQLLKDFAWRVTEELAEAMEAKHDREHFIEEIIDALHFLIELFAYAGMTHDEFTPLSNMKNMGITSMGDLPKIMWEFIEDLGVSMNCLKNKPWKQTHMETDVVYFKKQLKQTWTDFLWVLVGAGMSELDVYNVYFKKNAVNQFRQRSNY